VGVLDVIRAIPTPILEHVIYMVLRSGGPSETELLEQRYRTRIEALERGQARLQEVLGQPITVQTESSVPILYRVLDQLTITSGNCKEALRFAREDGMNHPETVKRLAQAQEILDELERHTLRPEVLVTLPSEQRQAIEQVMPAIREARQHLHNAPDGSPPTVESLSRAAAQLGDIATQVRVIQVLGSLPTPQPTQVPSPKDQGEQPYSRYAPDMSVDTGCLPCGRAHLGTIAAMLKMAAQAAKDQGMSNPDVATRLQTADEELTMLSAWDWTPERIAKSPPEDRAIIEAIKPQVEALHAALRQAHSPEDLGRLAIQAQDIRHQFLTLDLERRS
jgi:hypothetical protein